MGQALPPLPAVTIGSNPFSLLQKQAGELGPLCPKTVCPSNSPSGLFQKLYILILHEKCRKMVYYTPQFINFEPKLYSGLVCSIVTKYICIRVLARFFKHSILKTISISSITTLWIGSLKAPD